MEDPLWFVRMGLRNRTHVRQKCRKHFWSPALPAPAGRGAKDGPETIPTDDHFASLEEGAAKGRE